jgi:serine/threonine protein kinase
MDKLINELPLAKRPTYTLFGPLVRIATVGKGAYGTVDKYHTFDGRTVAIKIIQPSDEGLSVSSVCEIQALQILRGCPHVLRVIDIALNLMLNEEVDVNIMTDYHDNNLDGFASSLNVEQRCILFTAIFNQLTTGLAHIHNRGLIHLDIKPKNILVDYNGAYVVCTIADFGLTKRVNCSHPEDDFQINPEVYTLSYRPPEILIGLEYTIKADIWALGLTLLEYLIGRVVFKLLFDTKRELLRMIFDSLIIPVPFDSASMLYAQGKIGGHVDIIRLISANIPKVNLPMLPDAYITDLHSMLAIQPNSRPRATEMTLPLVDIPPGVTFLTRGPPLKTSTFDSNMYYVIYKWLTNTCGLLEFNTKIMLTAADLLDRYLANYEVIDRNTWQLIVATFISLAVKALENFILDIEKDLLNLCDNTFTMHDIKTMQIKLIRTMHYMTVSCETDDFAIIINGAVSRSIFPGDSYAKRSEIMRQLYFKLKERHISSGSLSYNQLIIEIAAL